MDLKPIETVYNGYRFRSRLEARWAVFFDTLGIKYEYEKEGYDLGKLGFYLPDFWLPDNNTWIEIKGRAPSRLEIVKLNRLTRLTGTSGHIFSGMIKLPSKYDVDDALNIASYSCFEGKYYDNYQCWGKCPVCGKTDIVFNGFGKYICSCTDSKFGCEHEDLLNAYKHARSARFEHGEKPRQSNTINKHIKTPKTHTRKHKTTEVKQILNVGRDIETEREERHKHFENVEIKSEVDITKAVNEEGYQISRMAKELILSSDSPKELTIFVLDTITSDVFVIEQENIDLKGFNKYLTKV